jgi:hypothetical protein
MMSIIDGITEESLVVVDFSSSNQNQESSPRTDELSEPHIGKWNVLVSQTNWEKGSLILHWRNDLIAAGLPNSVYSDEAWSRRVGNVTAQHVGRLRRVTERFGEKNKDFSGLFWSHFYAALEWDDAELWLEGAMQNGWSVAQMRVQRWETIGASDEFKPREEDMIVTDIDDDAYSHRISQDRIEGRSVEIGGGVIEGFDASTLTAAEPEAELPKKKESPKKSKPKQTEADGTYSTGELLTSLKNVSEFPSDLSEPMELLKTAILNHKLSGWKLVSANQVGNALDALKLLVSAIDG